MSVCFQSFNYPTSINCCLNKHTSQSQGKRNPTLVNHPQAEGSNKFSSFTKSSEDRKFSIPLSGQHNSIGIIGGVSMDSSLDFAKKLANCKLGDEERSSPPFILCSDPMLNKNLLTDLPSPSGKPESIYTDQSRIVENLRRKRAFLEKSGACCIVMPCHLLHSWHDEIKEGCSVHFLHAGDCVAHELKEAKLKPLEAGSPIRIGVLATSETLVGNVYRNKLENEGFEVVLPDKATMEHTVIPAVQALSRKDLEGAQNLFRIALQVLLVRAVNRVVLASDEFRELLPPDDPLWTKCIDPMDALARSSVKYAQSIARSK